MYVIIKLQNTHCRF